MEEGAERGSSPTSKTYVARGCIKTTAGPWVVRRPSGKGASETVWRTPSAKERENNRRRERVRRSVAAKIFAGLRAHGNYRLPKHADHNEVLKALCNEAGWHVEEDGTIFRKNCTEMKRLIPLVAASPGVSPSSSSSHVGQHRETTTCSARSSRKTSNSSTFSCRESDSGRVTPEQTSPDAANGGTDVGFLNNICPSHSPVELATHQYTTSALKIMKGEDLKLSNITGTRQKVHQKRVCELGQPATNKEQVESSEGEEYCCLWPLSIEAAEVNRSSSDPKGKLKPIERPAEFSILSGKQKLEWILVTDPNKHGYRYQPDLQWEEKTSHICSSEHPHGSSTSSPHCISFPGHNIQPDTPVHQNYFWCKELQQPENVKRGQCDLINSAKHSTDGLSLCLSSSPLAHMQKLHTHTQKKKKMNGLPDSCSNKIMS